MHVNQVYKSWLKIKTKTKQMKILTVINSALNFNFLIWVIRSSLPMPSSTNIGIRIGMPGLMRSLIFHQNLFYPGSTWAHFWGRPNEPFRQNKINIAAWKINILSQNFTSLSLLCSSRPLLQLFQLKCLFSKFYQFSTVLMLVIVTDHSSGPGQTSRSHNYNSFSYQFRFYPVVLIFTMQIR